MELGGKVAVVTGAGSGIGRGMALAFAREGMDVSLADLVPARLDAVAGEVTDLGVRVLTNVTDVSRPESVAELAESTFEALGAAHVVCNNAGVSSFGRQWEVSLADWQWVIDVCLWGVIHGVRTFVPRLLAQGQGGHVVNTSSMGGLLTSPYLGPYTASKHAVVGLSKSLRAELAGTGVGVSVVCPGEVQTGIVDAMRAHLSDAPGGLTPEASAVLDRHDAGLANVGMSAEDAGAMVAAAVREGQFWVLPNGARHLPSVRDDMDELFASS